MMNSGHRQSEFLRQLPAQRKADRAGAEQVGALAIRAHQAEVFLDQPAGQIERCGAEIADAPGFAIDEIFDTSVGLDAVVGASRRRCARDAKKVRIVDSQVLQQHLQHFGLASFAARQGAEHRRVFLAQAARLFTHLRRVVLVDVEPGLLGHRHQAERETVVALGEGIAHVLAQHRRGLRRRIFDRLIHR